MHSLGHTRSAHRANHLLHTPDAFVLAPLPGMLDATAIVHIAPAGGARFTQYTARFESGGSMAAAAQQRFIYVLDGELRSRSLTLGAGDYAYFSESSSGALSATRPTLAAVIEKPYLALDGVAPPQSFSGRESELLPQPLLGDEAIEVRSLVPADPAFDFAVNTMTYAPGASLPAVEMHVMEHGLLMLSGGGVYRLGEHWYPVTAGDFIWMAPYCPQWFGALGKSPAKYLIYKDWNR